MKLYKTANGTLLQFKEEYYVLQHEWDKLINRNNLYAWLLGEYLNGKKITNEEAAEWQRQLLPPIG
jgi:2-dehydro-3-deoxy-D-arabinonate dehydratase